MNSAVIQGVVMDTPKSMLINNKPAIEFVVSVPSLRKEEKPYLLRAKGMEILGIDIDDNVILEGRILINQETKKSELMFKNAQVVK
jgi:hypothetical protein